MRALLLAGLMGMWLGMTFVYEPGIHWKIKHYHVLMSVFALGVPPRLVERLIPTVGTFVDEEGVGSRDGNFSGVPYRMYIPGEEADESRTVVWVHGGGFVLGHVWEFQIDRSCRRLAAYSKTRVISVEYRKAPEHHFSAASDDVRAVLQHARRLFSHVALAGESAGATVALSVAMKQPQLIDHLLLVYPGLEHGIDPALLKNAWIVSDSVVSWFRSHHLVPESDEDRLELEDFNLLLKDAESHVDQVAHLPPTNLVSAGLDPLTLGVRKLEAKLLRAGVRYSHDHYPNSVHGFFCLDVDSSEKAIQTAAEKLFRL